MKFLLTSGGIKNDSIRNALVDLLGKPIAESTALFIPTAAHALPRGPLAVWRSTCDWLDLDWKEFGVLELTALPSIWEVAIPCICATGCSSPDWRIFCRRCARRSMWD